MGEVWKAEDLKLGRHVALKFLAPHLVSDPEIRERFDREARAAASLNHPNICTIHEIDEAEGKSFLAMELVEGKSLEARIEAGPLPLDKALDLARQSAEGLEAAHAKGIVHRDIKPGNILVTAEDRVKILDFGLALLTEGSRLTKLDTTVGTVAYMSPEQAQGADVDHRSDIWALGCVLYEMVSGQRPFKGQYDQALLYEIVNEAPEPLTGLRSGVPMELEWIVDKCLAKDREERYHHAKDLILDLTNLAKKMASGRSTVMSTAGAAIPPESGEPSTIWGLGRERLAWAAAAVMAIAALSVTFIHFSETAPQPQTTRFSIHPPDGVNFGARAAEISPDGRQLAFIGISEGEAQLWIRSLDSLEARPLAGTRGARHPFWSPDSHFIGFFTDGKLNKIDTTGGPAQTLAEATNGVGATWGQSSSGGAGVIVFSPGVVNSALFRISDAGGEPTPVTVRDNQGAYQSFPHFLPDGRHFLYLNRSGGEGAVYIGSLDTRGDNEPGPETKIPLLREDTPVRYMPASPGQPSGYLLFAREDSLLAQNFDISKFELTGQPFPIAEGILASADFSTPSDFSVSQTGVLAYHSGASLSMQQLVWFDRDGQRLDTVGEPGNHGAVSISPLEDRVAVSDFGGLGDIWMYDLARSTRSRFTFDPGVDFTHTWSPDGKRLAFSSNRNRSHDLYVKSTSGSGDAELLLHTENSKGPRSWSHDGRSLLFAERGEASWDLWVLPLEGEPKPAPYLQTKFNETLGQFSPNDRWVAYASDESGVTEIYVQSYPADGGKWQISTDGGIQPRWRADGRELFYLTADDRIMAVEIEAGETLQPGAPSMLFRAPEVNTFLPTSAFHFDVADNGERFLIDVAAQQGEQTPVTVVLNWQAELGR